MTVVFPSLGIRTPGELAKSEVDQVTFPEISDSIAWWLRQSDVSFQVLH